MGNKPHNNKRPTTNNGSRRSPGHRGRIPDRLQGHEGMHAIWGVPYGNLNSHGTQEQQAASSFVDESVTFVASAGPIGAQEGNATARFSPTTLSPLPDPPSGPSTSEHRDTVQTFLPQCATTSVSQPVEDPPQLDAPSAAQEKYGSSQGELTPSATSTPLSSALSGPPPRSLSESFPSFDARGAYNYEATPRSIPNLPAATNAVGYPNDYGSVALAHAPLVCDPSDSDSSRVPRGMRNLQSLSYRNALEALIQSMTNETNATPRAAPTLPPLSPPARLFSQSALEVPGSGTVDWLQQGSSATPIINYQPPSSMAARRASRSSHERRLAGRPYPLPSRACQSIGNDTPLYGMDEGNPVLGVPNGRGMGANAAGHSLEHIAGTHAPIPDPYSIVQGLQPGSYLFSTGPHSVMHAELGASSFDGSSVPSTPFPSDFLLSSSPAAPVSPFALGLWAPEAGPLETYTPRPYLGQDAHSIQHPHGDVVGSESPIADFHDQDGGDQFDSAVPEQDWEADIFWHGSSGDHERKD